MTEINPTLVQPRKFTLPMSELRPEAATLATAKHDSGHLGEQMIHEKDWHQHAIRYFAQGMNQEQVAEACGVTRDTVKNIANTLWFQERVTQLMAEQDVDIMEMFKNLRVGAIVKLASLATSAKSEMVQLSAVKEILDRNLGKPVQRMEQDTTVRSANPVQEAQELLREISLLRNETPPSSL